MAVFSTKSNPSTRENITNVFGAKTLLALVKLDLKLEMQPSNGPTTQSARAWSTQNESKQGEILGHISKPTFGEGRQAPDRQMFFVNSRPCALPQVSKAFNEVYKSFNVSQSPFIFANLVMDTNSYDVNVSPDKRTIMLHDQTALIESLKAELTRLFELQDHTVPQSQPAIRKLPSYQSLTLPRGPSVQTSLSEKLSVSDREFNEEAEGDSGISSAPQRPRKGSTGQSESLIKGWAGRDVKQRTEKPACKPAGRSVSTEEQSLAQRLQNTELPKPNRRNPSISEVLAEGSTAEENSFAGDAGVDAIHGNSGDGVPALRGVLQPQADPLSSAYDDLFSQRPKDLPKPVQDLNDSVARAHVGALQPPAPDAHRDEIDEELIPAVTPKPPKSTSGAVQNAFDRMRPKRTPLQTAEITVGEKTVSTIIGSPAYKKRRIYQPENSQSIAKFGASPLLARSLRNFAAPGTQFEDVGSSGVVAAREPSAAREDDEESDEESEVEEEEDSPQIEIPGARSRQPGAVSPDVQTSDGLDSLIPASPDEDPWDEDYMDEAEKRVREDEKIARMIQEAEDVAARPTEENLKRASQVLKNNTNRKDSTLQLVRSLDLSVAKIAAQLTSLESEIQEILSKTKQSAHDENTIIKDELDDADAEARLSLTVRKADFQDMHIIGQFNLGFILATRPSSEGRDELFIIDQHAADEKYNFERLQRTVTLQSQRLVRPKQLELSAIEEEIISNHADALRANGFQIESISHVDSSTQSSRDYRLLTLPMSANKTFTLSDLEELLHLLSEHPAGSSEIPRPSKVRSMLAMRACRSSIMVGKTLTSGQMRKVVRHMGEMEKPWNCPHGRPTMRHLAGLGSWKGWQEGEPVEEETTGVNVIEGGRTDWKGWIERKKGGKHKSWRVG